MNFSGSKIVCRCWENKVIMILHPKTIDDYLSPVNENTKADGIGPTCNLKTSLLQRTLKVKIPFQVLFGIHIQATLHIIETLYLLEFDR